MKKSIFLSIILLICNISFAQMGASPFSDPTSSNSIVWTAQFDTPPNIATNYSAWLAWKEKRIAQFEKKCPLRRSKTYYFSNNNSSNSNPCTFARPCQTWAYAVSLANSSGGDVAILLDTGSVFRENVNGEFIVDNVTIADYSDGISDYEVNIDSGVVNIKKPLILAATTQYATGGSTWTVQAGTGNMYRATENGDISWVLESNDRLGEVRGTHLIRMSSSATVDTTPNSWYFDNAAHFVYVNLGGTDPNTVPLEAIPSNLNNGVAFDGDGSRAENIIAIGFGCYRTTSITQKHTFASYTIGNEASYFKGVEGYYSGSHVMGLYNGPSSGGKAMFNNITLGFTKYNSNDETLISSYAQYGGQEFWCINCEGRYGTLKSSDWTYATKVGQGTLVSTHSSGSSYKAGLFVLANSRVKYSHTPAVRIALVNYYPEIDSADLTTARAFVDNSVLEWFNGTAAAVRIDGHNNTIFHRTRWYFKPIVESLESASGETPWNVYFINSYMYIDLATVGTGLYSIVNATSSTDNRYYFYNSLIAVKNAAGTSSARFGIDYDVRSNTGLPGSGIAANSKFINSILSIHKSGGGAVYYFGLTNQAANIKNNAYYQVTQATGQERGYNNDAGLVTLSSEAVIDTSDALLLQAGSTSFMPSHDINGKQRTVSPPDIGPTDFSS